MSKKLKRILFLTIFFILGLSLVLIVYIIYQKDLINNIIVKLIFSYWYILLIALIILYLYMFCNIIFKNNSKKIVKNIDTTKIKEYGVSKWMHNEILNYDSKKPEKTLKEFHHYFECDESNCDKSKTKKLNKNPAWVINAQYRTKDKNILVIPPISNDYEIYDGQDNILDVDKFKKSLAQWELNLEKNNSKYNLIYHTLEKLHLLVLGSTGSGKTQKLIFPGIIRNGMLDNDKQPTMVITDPKGEIYEQTSGILEEQGYNVKVLNFRDTTSSYAWNPLFISWNYRKESINYRKNFTFTKTFTNLVTVKEYINNEIIELNNQKSHLKCSNHDLKNCIDCINKFENNVINSGWEKGEEIKLFVSNGRYHLDEFDFDVKVENHIKNLKSLSEKEVMSLASIIIQHNGNGDPFWTDSARTFFIGIAVIMLEIMDNNQDAMPLEKFNIVNVIKMMDETDFEEWINKFKNAKIKNGEDSFGLNQILTTINSSEQTQKSIITSAKSATTLYTFTSVQGLLCSTQNLINMDEITYGEKPTVLYLIIPDDDKTFHPLVACFIDQLYKTSVKIATNNKISGRIKEATLTRQIQFYLDEFGNFPKIPTFAQMITVARSRNIFFMLILQDYGQLSTAYGDTESKTIRYNCNASIYIRTNDTDTAEKLSKEYGDKPVLSFSISDKFKRVEDKDNKNKLKEETASPITIPLVRSNEILNLDDNFMIIKKTGKNPALIHSIYSYKVEQFRNYMNYKRSFVPSNAINYKRDHYFNFIEKDYIEWINLLTEDKETVIWEDVMNIKDEEIKIDNQNLQEKVNDFHDYNYKQLLEEQNKNLKSQRRIINSHSLRKIMAEIDNNSDISKETDENEVDSLFYDLKFEDKKTIKEKIEINYLKLEKIKEKYYQFINILPTEMTTREKREYNGLYEEQLKISEYNKKLLERLKETRF
ncbi:type IV secretory system conjugative DNA transfer family protein [Spiroplasma endosymbiont of Cantharis lateralis]|uniref:type IV secretory system conjugative DNA transfer family protein n=1 Tax=Spiroplasma endosymbiont of Cantharis lateralis TaxID=3066277 RepID=UPI00313DC86A